MAKINVVKSSLFDAPKGSVLLHACNTKGVWGSGIAKQFAERFPDAKEKYSWMCSFEGKSLLGKCLLIDDGDYTVACIFTSEDYGANVDTPAEILKHTKSAIADLLSQTNKPIHSCKINSGLFNVPWEKTKRILDASGREFTIHEL